MLQINIQAKAAINKIKIVNNTKIEGALNVFCGTLTNV